jgi:hypothetical protein
VLEVGTRTCVVEGRREEGGRVFPPPTNSLKSLQVPVKHVGWGSAMRCDAVELYAAVRSVRSMSLHLYLQPETGARSH